MPTLLGDFDPTVSGSIPVIQCEVHGHILAWNESNQLLRLQIGTFTNVYLPPWQSRLLEISGTITTIAWMNLGQIQAGTAPLQTLFFEYYGPEEKIVEQHPASLVRQTNLGNSVPVSTSTTQLINDGNIPSTTLIEATPSDAVSSTWQADVSGNLQIKSDNAGTLTNLLQLISGATPKVLTGAAATLTEVLGNLSVDGNATLNNVLNVSGTSNLNGINGTTLFLSGGKVFGPGGWVWIDFSDNVNMKITPNGGTFTIGSGSLKFQDGSLCNQIHRFTGTGSGTFNHNCSATPNAIEITTSVVGSQTMGYDSVTGTQVHVTTGAGLAWVGIAFVLA
jgi:hypothetical protein